jgi:hypothetical protein
MREPVRQNIKLNELGLLSSLATDISILELNDCKVVAWVPLGESNLKDSPPLYLQHANTTCAGRTLSCNASICQSGVPGGEWCGHFAVAPPVGPALGTDISRLAVAAGTEVVLVFRLWATDLYTMQFL